MDGPELMSPGFRAGIKIKVCHYNIFELIGNKNIIMNPLK